MSTENAVSASEPQVVESPYADPPVRVLSAVLAVVLACGALSAFVVAYRFAGAARLVLIAVGIGAGWLSWLSVRDTRPHVDTWEFDDVGWVEKDPIRGPIRRVYWQRVSRVSLLRLKHGTFVLIGGSDEYHDSSVSLDRLLPGMAAVLVDQLARHVPVERIDPDVFALCGSRSDQ